MDTDCSEGIRHRIAQRLQKQPKTKKKQGRFIKKQKLNDIPDSFHPSQFNYTHDQGRQSQPFHPIPNRNLFDSSYNNISSTGPFVDYRPSYFDIQCHPSQTSLPRIDSSFFDQSNISACDGSNIINSHSFPTDHPYPSHSRKKSQSCGRSSSREDPSVFISKQNSMGVPTAQINNLHVSSAQTTLPSSIPLTTRPLNPCFMAQLNNQKQLSVAELMSIKMREQRQQIKTNQMPCYQRPFINPPKLNPLVSGQSQRLISLQPVDPILTGGGECNINGGTIPNVTSSSSPMNIPYDQSKQLQNPQIEQEKQRELIMKLIHDYNQTCNQENQLGLSNLPYTPPPQQHQPVKSYSNCLIKNQSSQETLGGDPNSSSSNHPHSNRMLNQIWLKDQVQNTLTSNQDCGSNWVLNHQSFQMQPDSAINWRSHGQLVNKCSSKNSLDCQNSQTEQVQSRREIAEIQSLIQDEIVRLQQIYTRIGYSADPNGQSADFYKISSESNNGRVDTQTSKRGGFRGMELEVRKQLSKVSEVHQAVRADSFAKPSHFK